jgi:phosphoribosylformylglycinamidine synthase PurS subunit
MYKVELMILNKEGIRDPEGETIQRYIAEKSSDKIKSVRVGKYLIFDINADNEIEARDIVYKLANENRLYNPIVHKINIRVNEIESSNN